MKRLFPSFMWKIVLYLVCQFVQRPQEKRFQESLEERDVILYFCFSSKECNMILFSSTLKIL